MLESTTTFLFYAGNVVLAIPVNTLVPFLIVFLYILLILCGVMSLYNMAIPDFQMKQSVAMTLLLVGITSGGWYIWYLIQLT